MAQLASASGLGPEGPVFESQYPDNRAVDFQLLFFLFNFDARLQIDVASSVKMTKLRTGDIKSSAPSVKTAELRMGCVKRSVPSVKLAKIRTWY